MSFEEKPHSDHVENLKGDEQPEDDQNVEMTWRTYAAVASFVLCQIFQVWSLFGVAFAANNIATDLDQLPLSHWLPITTSLGQAIFAPLYATCSERLGHKKLWIALPLAVSCAGAIVSGTAKNFTVMLVGQALTSVGLGTTALMYSAPSEIVSRRARPLVQGFISLGAAIGGVLGVIANGALAQHMPTFAWRYSFYIQFALGCLSTVIFACFYNPPAQSIPARASFSETLHDLDVFGVTILASGLAILLVGLSIGDNPFPWGSAKPIALMVVGFCLLAAFAFWEYHRKNGIFPVAMFRQRNFIIAIVGVSLEGVLLFSVVVFYPVVTVALWEPQPLLSSLRVAAFLGSSLVIVIPLGYFCTRYRALKIPLVVGFLLYVVGLCAMSSATAATKGLPILYVCILGSGFAAILLIVVTIAQLATPPELIGTASSILVSTRAIGASMSTAFLGAILTATTTKKIPAAIIAAVLPLGFPPSSLPAFIPAVLAQNMAALSKIPGVTPAVIGGAVGGVHEGLAQSFRVLWLSVVPFAVLGAVVTCFLQKEVTMTSHVDAPMEHVEAAGGGAALA